MGSRSAGQILWRAIEHVPEPEMNPQAIPIKNPSDPHLYRVLWTLPAFLSSLYVSRSVRLTPPPNCNG